MSTILTINAGSSSIRYELFQMPKEVPLLNGYIDSIGATKSVGRKSTHLVEFEGKTNREECVLKNHEEAFTSLFEALASSEVLVDIQAIDMIVHRVVHGGRYFSKPTRITASVLTKLRKIAHLAPLHNPANIEGIDICKKQFRGIAQYAIFDTAFHTEMPEQNRTYGLPRKLANDEGLFRFGFHGTSCKYIFETAKPYLRKRKKILICHLGGGVSITAIREGKSIYNTMGFTPLEGPLMGKRSGTIDPGIIFHLARQGYDLRYLEESLDKRSGLLGVSGVSSDMREILRAMKRNKQAKLAYDVFIIGIIKHIGACIALLGGIDAIIFSAGIGEHIAKVRADICSAFSYMRLLLDAKANKKNEIIISSSKSKILALIIPTNEALQMAREGYAFTQK